MKSQKIIVIIVAVVVCSSWFFLNKNKNVNTDHEVPQSIKTSDTVVPVSDESSYEGTISTSTDTFKNIYVSQKYNLRFSYPVGWRIGDNHLGFGSFQIFNFPEPTQYQKSFHEGQNKIEIVTAGSGFVASTSDYPSEIIQSKRIMFPAGLTTRYDTVTSDNEKTRTYSLQLPNKTGEFLYLTIYGDPLNFQTLDTVVQSIEWTK